MEKPHPTQQTGAGPSHAQWFRVDQLGDLKDSWGETALVNGQQLALFRVDSNRVFAVSHADPATRAHVMARGLVGSHGGRAPLHRRCTRRFIR